MLQSGTNSPAHRGRARVVTYGVVLYAFVSCAFVACAFMSCASGSRTFASYVRMRSCGRLPSNLAPGSRPTRTVGQHLMSGQLSVVLPIVVKSTARDASRSAGFSALSPLPSLRR